MTFPRSVDEARAEILARVTRQPTLRVPLADAVGHVLAEPVRAPYPLPPWTNAAMDGYAVRAEDVRTASDSAPVTLRVVGEVAAGRAPSAPLGPGEAMRIFTGAPVPEGADSVVRQEDTDRGTREVVIRSARDAGSNVRRAGADLAEGSEALAAGTAIGPRQVGLLAALAVTHPLVHRRPRIGIFATGDEVAPLDQLEEILARRRLADVNGPALAALVRDTGGIAVPLGLVGDDPDRLRERIADAGDVDLLLTAGGVSVGDHDHLRPVMGSLGAELVFTRVRVRPGGPTSFGMLRDGRAWIGLPGNPVSATVTFELFARPAIRVMAGHADSGRRLFPTLLEEPVHPDRTLEMYFRAAFDRSAGDPRPRARLTGPQGSGMLTSVARSDGLIRIPPGDRVLPAGTEVWGWEW